MIRIGIVGTGRTFGIAHYHAMGLINDGRAEGLAEGKAESIKNLMSTMNVSIDQAMDILKTPPEERQYFKDLLAKEQ